MKRSRAVVLGAVQGPTELLPVSSSAHLTLIPWLAGWDADGRDPELQKSFEVALHAGAAAALLVGQRRVIADRRPQVRDRGRATAMDGLALGLAQAAALAPGISRNGATLTAARWRGFTRQHANMLSRTVALPVIVGAAVLKGIRMRRGGLPRQARAGFAAGTATSFASTLASQELIRLVERDSALWPYAAYRGGLASLVLAKLWRDRRRSRRFVSRPGDTGRGVPVSEPVAAGNGAPSWARADAKRPSG
jgi:undecaprenyl-diphosphatase